MIRKLLLISMTTMLLTESVVANRDGCKVIGDACVCSNTGVKGMCFPGTLSQTPDELYCVCQSLTMTADEITQDIIKLYLTKDANKHVAYQRKLQWLKKSYDYLEGLRFLKSIRLKSKAELQKRDRDIKNLESALRTIVATGSEPVLEVFYEKPQDGCSYPGEACVCANTGAEGVCSINKPTGKKKFFNGVLYCHCD